MWYGWISLVEPNNRKESNITSKKTKCYNHSWIKNKKGYTPIFLCFTDKIKQGHVRCKKRYTPWIKRLVLSVYDKYYTFLFKLTSSKYKIFRMIQINVRNKIYFSNQFFVKLITKCYYPYKNTFHVGNEGLQRSLISTPLMYYFHTTDSVFWCSAIMRTGM